MKNNLKKTIINILLISIFIYIFTNSKEIKNYVLYAINLWTNNLIPSLFPFLLITKLLIYYGMSDYLNNLFGKKISKIFNISKNSAFIVITSIFTGFPTGSIYIKDLIKKNIITIDEANHLIMFTNFANPIFIISVIGENLLNNKKIGIFIFIIHIITGLITGYIFKNNNKFKTIETTFTKKHDNTFVSILIDSIYDTFRILINMLGIIIFFLMIMSLIDTFFKNNILLYLIKGLIEITTGIIFISNSNINIHIKVSIICFLLSFSGLSIHFQVKSIINDTKISYKKYFIGRIVHSILCFLFSYILFSMLFFQ